MKTCNLKLISSALLFVLVICFSGVSLVEAASYFPNGIKDTYTYGDEFGGTSTAKVDYISGGWKHWTEFAGFGPTWVWTYNYTYSEHVFVYANGRTQLFTNFNGAVGDVWKVTIGSCNKNVTVTLAEKDQTVTVPAGTFDDCILLKLTTSCADAGVEAIWFAKDVGVVKWTSRSIAGPIDHELEKAVVKGITYPESVPITLAIKGGTDRFNYWINMMPPIDPNRPPTLLYAEFAITNTTGEPIEFIFEACEFDICIYDEDGNMVSHMNRGKEAECAREIADQKTLENGKTWKYNGKVELTDKEGRDLPQGDYTVECILLSNPKFSTSHSIKIRYAY